MSKHEEKEITGEEIKKEFQVERMILFSDAVFAIVITLMAIEIRLPETGGKEGALPLGQALEHLLPVIVSYCISFVFIGAIWYQHLRMFSLLKDYDRGLIVRNLVLLFFVSLFPFSSSVITHEQGVMTAMFFYLGIILLSVAAQYFLYRYILVERPGLRISTGIAKHMQELRKQKISLVSFASTYVLITLTSLLITKPELKPMSVMWMAVFPFVYRWMAAKKAKHAKAGVTEESGSKPE